jgi:hypothetical protein
MQHFINYARRYITRAVRGIPKIMELWSLGLLEPWAYGKLKMNSGRLGLWNPGTLELWAARTLELNSWTSRLLEI